MRQYGYRTERIPLPSLDTMQANAERILEWVDTRREERIARQSRSTTDALAATSAGRVHPAGHGTVGAKRRIDLVLCPVAIAVGCGGGNFCPDVAVSRGQMSVFLATTFGLTLYGN